MNAPVEQDLKRIADALEDLVRIYASQTMLACTETAAERGLSQNWLRDAMHCAARALDRLEGK